MPCRIIKGWMIAVIMVMAFLPMLPSTPTASYAQAGWSPPIQVSSTEAKSWFPDIIVDATGRVHTVWASSNHGFDTVMYRATNPNGVWGPSTDVYAEDVRTRQLQEATRPALALDASGVLHMTHRVMSVYYSKVQASNAANVSAWTKTTSLNENQVNYFSRIAVDSKGILHVVYTDRVEGQQCLVCLHLFYRQSKDQGQTWSNSTEISEFDLGAAKPQIVIDKQDTLHLVWEAGLGGTLGQVLAPTRVFYTVSHNTGKTWSVPFEMGGGQRRQENFQAKKPTINVDANNRVIVVWHSIPEDRIYFQVSADAGVSWSDATLIPGIWGTWSVVQMGLDSYATAKDSAGQVHLVMDGRMSQDERTIGLYHLVWNGASWSSPDVVFKKGVLAPQWPRIAVGLGNQLHVVWYMDSNEKDDQFDTDNSNFQIWYSKNLAQAPAIAPINYPTPTALPLPTATAQLFSPTPTTIPVANKVLPRTTMDSIIGENSTMGILALAAIPVVVITLLMLLLRQRR